jgi:2,3-bisphosphoglycerate-independent phosphoglycerate mutase
MLQIPRPLVLAVLDGWGHRPDSFANAVLGCGPRHFLELQQRYPSTLLEAAGEAVGLPDGFIGNSEVGHTCLGAGRIVLQDLTRIHHAIAKSSFQNNPVLLEAFDGAKRSGATLHLMGLLSDGGVHSHIEHLRALVALAGRRGLDSVRVHAFLDGRDTPPKSALDFVQRAGAFLGADGPGRIASVCGRYFAMDRDRRWDRTRLAFRSMVHAEGNRAESAEAAIRAAYDRAETDEFVRPALIATPGAEPAVVRDGDAILFFNFRADRARQLTRAFTEKEFGEFDAGRRPALVSFTCMTEYDEKWKLPYAFHGEHPEHGLGETLAERHLPQVRIAETEKYAHVTYFFNGGREQPFSDEERVLIPSPKVATYDLQPEMSASGITDAVLKALGREERPLILVNFANADMVGHTGRWEAALAACRTVDDCLGRVAREVQRLGGTLIVTADHGNAEQMLQSDGKTPHTAHTTNPVPFILAGESLRGARLRGGGLLGDIAPTLLSLLGIDSPLSMTGKSLLAADHAA